MRTVRWLTLTGSLTLAASVVAAAPGIASTHPAPHHARPGTLAFAQARSHPDGTVAANSQVSFDLVLSLRNAAGAQAFERDVSTPGSAQFHHYLTDAQWVSRYGPARAAASKAESWLRREGFTAGPVPKDRLFVPAQGTAQRVEHAFGIQLGYYKVNGKRIRLAKDTISVPSSLAGTVSGTVGINEYVATSGLAVTGGTSAVPSPNSTKEPGPPAGFRNPQPCSKYWGQKADTKDSKSLYKPFVYPEPYDICGYKPAQLRGAYGLAGSVARGNDGKGVTVAIVDAYDSPHLLANAQQYFKMNDPSHPLLTTQFTNDEPSKIDNLAECGGNGWYPEQALDVEAAHSMAPGANITFVGAKSCLNPDLLAADNTAVTSGASVVSNSWLEAAGDLLDDAATHTAFDNVFLLADDTGVSVLFCTGDNGDNFADFGMTVPDYPASSPYVTAVGGTTLEVDSSNTRQAEYGWSTAKQILCEPMKAANCGSATKPEGTLLYDDGAGAGTSYFYTQPFYQAPVVPSALALRNESLFGTTPMRVTPDISMDADPQSGMLIGLTEAFPNGNYYDQFKEGGTSLATPLLAGVIADTDQAASSPLGFLNPELYKAYQATPAAFDDIVPPANPDAAAVVRADYTNEVNPAEGYVVSLRAINYAGPETYCDGTGNCATRDVTTTTAPGYDSLTGLGSVGSQFIATLSKY